jgi:5-methylcytosine-specific restriction endonuclease McrA
MQSVPQPPAVASKRCTKCGAAKPITEYYVKDKRTGRLMARCKACHHAQCEEHRRANLARYAEGARARYQADPEQARAIAATSREKHREAINERERTRRATPEVQAQKAAYRAAKAEERRAYNAAYREAHRDEIRAKSRAYYAADPDAAKERIARSTAANPEKYQGIRRQWKAANKDAVNASTHRRRARIKGNGGSYTAAEWRALKAAHDFRCLMCERQEPAIRLTVDHVIPISEGGPNTIDNIQPLCKSCNSKKHRRALDLRAQEKG